MARAIGLARGRLGRTAPNPPVGCVVVKAGSIVGEGATGEGGRPHAEEVALTAAGDAARGATAYVTLEPCLVRSSGADACSTRLVSAGLARVVIAQRDPHPNGALGADRLRSAGIDVVTGVGESACLPLTEGFFSLTLTGRPMVGVSADGASFDAEFRLGRRETFEEALDRMGREGLTRVFVRPGTPLLAALRSRGLVSPEAQSAAED